MTNQFYQRLEKELNQRREDSLLRNMQVCPPYQVNLSANDYLQLRHHPKIIESAQKTIEEYGSGSGASPLLSGYLPCHKKLLKQLLTWMQKSTGLLFNSGFMANQAVLKHLPGTQDMVLADKLVHHSIIQGLSQCKAKFKRYNHLDLNRLEELLDKYQKNYETLFVVTESVFSIDGDYPNLHRLASLKAKIPFIWILDEAHGIGVFGQSGAGLAEETDVLPQVDILIGTLGKALASMGAYVIANSATVIDYLVNYAGELIYSTFMAPSQAGTALAAIEQIREASEKRNYLRTLARQFRRRLVEYGWKTNDFDSQILPIIIGNANDTLNIRDFLLENGFLVGALRPPTVPIGTSRLRISMHSGVTEDQLDKLLNIMNRWKYP